MRVDGAFRTDVRLSGAWQVGCLAMFPWPRDCGAGRCPLSGRPPWPAFPGEDRQAGDMDGSPGVEGEAFPQVVGHVEADGSGPPGWPLAKCERLSRK